MMPSLSPLTGVIVGLVLLVITLAPLIAFEIWLRRPRRVPTLELRADAGSGHIRVEWVPAGILADRVDGFSVLRETVGSGESTFWTVPDFNETVMEDWAVRPGNEYCYEVTMYGRGRQGRYPLAEATVTAGLGLTTYETAISAKGEDDRERVHGAADGQAGVRQREGR